MTTPSATTASHSRARACATTGSSTDPDTCSTTVSVTWQAFAAASARSSICSVRSACQRVTAMPSRSPDASTVYSFGEPNPAIVPCLLLCPTKTSARAAGDLVQLVEQMSHPVPFGAQVPHVLVVYAHRHRLAAADLEAVAFEPGPLGWVVREQSHAAYAKVVEDLGTRAVVARVGRQPQVQVRVDGVASLVLQLVRLQLVHQPDAASLVPAHIEHDAATLRRDALHRGVQLR